MRYRELAPPPDLAAVVRCFWILEDPAAAPGRADERILPDGCPEIVVHYGSPMAARRGEGPLERQAGAVVAGQIRGALRLAPGGPMGAVGARLQPWAAARLLRERLDRLTDRIVPLDDLWGRAAGELLEQVAESGGDDARVAYFGAALRRRLAARAPG
ncbi:MAG TPA: DUF6597 domain-containing transcriptional factor, partial [Planctomycetota bacterium]|nr:DUF6597 domain-containing transcriptional factor [Planctomycetota bacterium]